MGEKYILGVSDSHNGAAALLDDQGVLFALQEERPKRIKNYSGLPKDAISWVMATNGLKPSDVDVVALAGLHQPPDRNRSELLAEYRNISSFTSHIKRMFRGTPVFAMKRNSKRKQRINGLVDLGFRKEQIQFFDHHQCHAATAYYGFGQYTAPVLVITCDGAGDGLCATVSIGEEGKLTRLYSVDWDHSIGVLFAVVTYMMGMVPLEHEYKMMGMAPYAKGKDANRIAEKILGLFVWDSNGLPVWSKKPDVPHMWYIKPVLKKLFFEERFDAIMAGVQLFTEKMLKEFILRSIRTTGIGRIALSGGVFMNVKANKEIMELDEVEDIFVYPSCGDETNAIGGCYLVSAKNGSLPSPIGDFCLGPKFNDEYIMLAIEASRERCTLKVTKPDDINQMVAEVLSQGKVVARFSGKEEFGARSLGNRAILADPRNPAVIKQINEMIKNRDFWMPFAASVLDEYAEQYLVNPKGIDAPYMILSFDTTQEGCAKLKAGTHPYDGTCRPQVVKRKDNPEYWDLIKKFADMSGVGGLVNTSLNLHGLPLVHDPADALYVLEKSGLQYLAIGSYLIEKCDDPS